MKYVYADQTASICMDSILDDVFRAVGVRPIKSPPPKTYDYPDIREMMNKGMMRKDIAKALGVGKYTVTLRARRMGMSFPLGRTSRENIAKANAQKVRQRLAVDQVTEYDFLRRSKGLTQAEALAVMGLDL